MDIFYLIVSIVIGILLLIASVYILAIYCHPEDGGIGSSIWCKFLVVLGLSLSWLQVLLLPMDIYNSRGEGQGMNMAIMWQIVYLSILAMISFLLPTAIFLYESDEDQNIIKRILDTLCQEFAVLLIFGLGIVVSYFYLRETAIPIDVEVIEGELMLMEYDYQIIETNYTQFYVDQKQVTSLIQPTMKIELPIYVMGIISFLGFFFFVLFGGVGLSALPIELIRSFMNRPTVQTSMNAAAKKADIIQKTKVLIQLGEAIQDDEKEANFAKGGFFEKRRRKSKFKQTYKIYNHAVNSLSEEFEIFQEELNIESSNPLVYIGKLIMGIIGIIISILWWVHILIYMVIRIDGFPLYSFLNNILIKLEQLNITFLGTMILAIFCLYLLWAITVGNFKVGVTIPFFMTIHPMIPNETWMNSFLFNIAIILICSVSLTHFITMAFDQYCRLAESNFIFNVLIKNLKFYQYFFKNRVFEISFLSWSGISALYYMYRGIKNAVQLLEEKKNKFKKKQEKNQDIELKDLNNLLIEKNIVKSTDNKKIKGKKRK